MEEKKENAGGLFKTRTYGACLSEGIKFPTRNVLLLLKHLALPIVCMVVCVCLATLFLGDAYRYVNGADFAREWPQWGRVGLCVLLYGAVCLLPGAFCLGRTVFIIRFYGKEGGLPLSLVGLKSLGEKQTAVIGKAFCFLAGGLLLWSLVVVLSCSLIGPGWLRVVVCLLGILAVSLPYVMRGLFYLYGDTDVPSGWATLRQCYKHWGALAAVLLLGGALAAVLVFLAVLPAAVIFQAGYLSDEALRVGDPSDVPSYFLLLQVVSYALGTFFSCMAFALPVFSLAFLYGSIRQVQSDNDAYAAEQQRMEDEQ